MNNFIISEEQKFKIFKQNMRTIANPTVASDKLNNTSKFTLF